MDEFEAGLFDGEVDETTTETITEENEETEETEVTKEVEEESTDTKPSADTTPSEENFELTFLGEKKSVPKDELIRLAQMGMNYDRKKETFDKSDAFMKRLNDLAGGQNVDDFFNDIETALQDRNRMAEENAINQRVSQLIQGGKMTPEMAEQYARLERQNQLLTYGNRQAQQRATEQNKLRESLSNFLLKNPTFKDEYPDGFPQEMVDMMQNGKSVEDAWTSMQFDKVRNEKAELEKKIAELERLQKNKNVANTALQNDGENEDDAFLRGLFGN